MNKKMILSIFKNLKVALFEEMTNGRYFGNLVYTDRIFSVKLYKDSVCQYICLEYLISDVKDIKDSIESINERVITGRYIADNTKPVLQSFFPIIEDKFIEQQLYNSICVLERMIHICKH